MRTSKILKTGALASFLALSCNWQPAAAGPVSVAHDDSVFENFIDLVKSAGKLGGIPYSIVIGATADAGKDAKEALDRAREGDEEVIDVASDPNMSDADKAQAMIDALDKRDRARSK